MLTFHLDEDSEETALVDSLRSRGISVSTGLEARLQGATDLQQLEWCTRNRFTLVTHNIGDFVRLHTSYVMSGRSHYGIILMRQQTLGTGEKVRRLIKIGGAFSIDQMKNRLEYLSNWGVPRRSSEDR